MTRAEIIAMFRKGQTWKQTTWIDGEFYHTLMIEIREDVNEWEEGISADVWCYSRDRYPLSGKFILELPGTSDDSSEVIELCEPGHIISLDGNAYRYRRELELIP